MPGFCPCDILLRPFGHTLLDLNLLFKFGMSDLLLTQCLNLVVSMSLLNEDIGPVPPAYLCA